MKWMIIILASMCLSSCTKDSKNRSNVVPEQTINRCDTVSAISDSIDSIALRASGQRHFYKNGDILHRWEVFNSWKNDSFESSDRAITYVYDSYIRHDTIIDVMKEYWFKKFFCTQIFFKTKKKNKIRVLRLSKRLQNEDFDSLIQLMKTAENYYHLTPEEYIKMCCEGYADITYKLTPKKITYCASNSNEPIFIRNRKFDKAYLEYGVRHNENKHIPYIIPASFKHGDIEEYVKQRLNKKTLADAVIPKDFHKALVELYISENGDVYDVKITKRIHQAIDSNIIQICKMLPPFEPQKEDGKKVKSKVDLTINFK